MVPRSYPLSPRILLERKAGAYLRSLPLVLLLGLSATSIPSAWGPAWKEMARDAPWCLCAPASWEGAGAGRLHQPLVLRKSKGTPVLKVAWCVRTGSPRRPLHLSCLWREVWISSPFLCLLAPGTPDGLHPLCPPTSFLGNLWPRSLRLPWLACLPKNQGSERLGPFLSSCPREIHFVRRALRRSSRPSRREAEAVHPSPPRAPPPSPPCASSWPESRRGRKGPLNFSLIRLDPERHFLGATSHLHQRFPSLFPGRSHEGTLGRAGHRGRTERLPEGDGEELPFLAQKPRCYVPSGSGGSAWASRRNSWRGFRAQRQAQPCLGALPFDLSGPRSWEAVTTGASLRKEPPEDRVGARTGNWRELCLLL